MQKLTKFDTELIPIGLVYRKDIVLANKLLAELIYKWKTKFLVTDINPINNQPVPTTNLWVQNPINKDWLPIFEIQQ